MDALAHSISEQYLENFKLKRRISELEDALSPKLLFVEPLSMMALDPIPDNKPSTTPKVRKDAKILNGIWMYVAGNINTWFILSQHQRETHPIIPFSFVSTLFSFESFRFFLPNLWSSNFISLFFTGKSNSWFLFSFSSRSTTIFSQWDPHSSPFGWTQSFYHLSIMSILLFFMQTFYSNLNNLCVIFF